ncbi:hypothetical protein TCON_2618 [Astathelohania contejeani]|uniref:Ricin B lectin domain-containing protein n=1 Tax=Astathelohania contejeani TaxID=164912 RepID=A0ABQ7HVH6_9MICR|nr:hypothetical protein TCON_2618 [Thelohania contejeani]
MVLKLSIFIHLIYILSSDKELQFFLNQDIKIFFSVFENYHLSKKIGENNTNGEFCGMYRHLNPNEFGFDDRARISPNGNGYEITIGGDRICTENKRIEKCKEGGKSIWNIERRGFGYTISQDDKCITQASHEVLSMKKCTDSEDQLFDFKRIIETKKCTNDSCNKNDSLQNRNEDDIKIKCPSSSDNSESSSSEESSFSDVSEVIKKHVPTHLPRKILIIKPKSKETRKHASGHIKKKHSNYKAKENSINTDDEISSGEDDFESFFNNLKYK